MSLGQWPTRLFRLIHVPHALRSQDTAKVLAISRVMVAWQPTGVGSWNHAIIILFVLRMVSRADEHQGSPQAPAC